MEEKESFLKRWSRLKQDAAQPGVDKTKGKSVAKAQDLPKSQLTPIEKLDINSDFSGYMQSKIEESLRRTALKKLFRDPHFSFENMDKLDIYIDDYNLPDPIPSEMLAKLLKSGPQLFPSKDEGSLIKEGNAKPVESQDERDKIVESKIGEIAQSSGQAVQPEAAPAEQPGQNVKGKG